MAALRALNELAGHLLEQAASNPSPDAAVALVADAAALVPSTEIFEVAAADALERGGRPDLAATRLAAALAIAPRRTDLHERLDRLRGSPVASRPTRSDARVSPLRLGLAGLLVLTLGTFIGTVLAPRDSGQFALASLEPPPASTRPSGDSSAPSARPSGSSAAPSPPVPTASPAPTVSLTVRAALDADPLLATLAISVEQIGDLVRISGEVPDAATVRAIEDVAASAAPHAQIDVTGLIIPRKRFVFVQSGDTLWTIAARLYNDPRRWRDIAAANPGIDPHALSVGQRIEVPN